MTLAYMVLISIVKLELIGSYRDECGCDLWVQLGCDMVVVISGCDMVIMISESNLGVI